MSADAFSPSPRVRELRARLDHPVVDGDGHLLESVPLLFDFLRAVGGDGLAKDFGEMLRTRPPFSHGDPARGLPRAGWWGTAKDALDIATCTAPGLLASRLDEIGLDFAILYPSLGLAIATLPDADLRRGAARALSRMNAEICREHAERLAPSAVIPMHAPEEAVDELRFPGLRFGFLEGGVGWAPDLLRSLEEHWEKRSGAHLYETYDPARVDHARLRELLAQHGFPASGPMGVGDGGEVPRGDWERDEFEDSGLREESQLQDVLARQFFFGCEADDRSVYRAFHARGNPFGIALRALAFENPVRLHLEANPRFFEGSAVEGAVRALLPA